MERKEHKKKLIHKVEPLRTKKDIRAMESVLRVQGSNSGSTETIGRRNEMLFKFGINTGLRVSDIIKLKVSDVKDVDRFTIREKKTGKKRTVFIKNIRKSLTEYITKMKLKDDDWLFPSRKHGYHVSRVAVYKSLSDAGEVLGRDDIGTHTMRKTFGYWYIKGVNGHAGGRIEDLMVIFNHSSQAITKRYIGIEQEDIEDTLDHFKL